jgi:RNase P subunit RPR2
MKLHCSQCKKILVVGDSCEIAFENDRVHLFCSKGCKEKWEERRSTKKVEFD